MKILIIGISGTLGHQIYTSLKKRGHTVLGTTRRQPHEFVRFIDFLDPQDIITAEFKDYDKLICEIDNLDYIINAAAVTRQATTIKEMSEQLRINSWLPKKLIGDVPLIQISSDVAENPDSIYAISKALGEPKDCMVIRTCFYGHQLFNHDHMIDRFVHSPETNELITDHKFSPIYAGRLAERIADTVESAYFTGPCDIYGPTISRPDLLELVNTFYGLNKNIIKTIPRPDRIQKKTEWVPPHGVMVEEMWDDYCTRYVSNIKGCRHCYKKNLIGVLSLNMIPLAGGFLRKEDLLEDKKYPLTLVQCEDCETIQTREVIERQQDIFRNGTYLSSVSLSKHFSDLASQIKRDFPDKETVLEIGCNDGVLLGPLSKSFRCVGVDPSINVVEYINKLDLPFYNRPFDDIVVHELKTRFKNFDIITANNCLAHIENIEPVFSNIASLMHDDSIFIFEVQHLKNLIEDFQYDFLYHEHVFYYSIKAIKNILTLHDMKITKIEEIPTHGGSIRIYARLKDHPSRELEIDDDVDQDDLAEFFMRILEHKRKTRELFDSIKSAKVAAYGASGRSVTYTNFCGLTTDDISYFVDDSPQRAGKYIPGVHIPIYSPIHLKEDEPDYIAITAWTFKDQILKKLDWYKGKIIITFPEPHFG